MDKLLLSKKFKVFMIAWCLFFIIIDLIIKSYFFALLQFLLLILVSGIKIRFTFRCGHTAFTWIPRSNLYFIIKNHWDLPKNWKFFSPYFAWLWFCLNINDN